MHRFSLPVGVRPGLVAAAVCLLAASPLAFAERWDTSPVSPRSDGIVGARPVLKFAVDGFEPNAGLSHNVRFRVEVSRDGFEEEVRSWDMKHSMRGWSVMRDGAAGLMLTLPEPLEAGMWEWRVIVREGPAEREPSFVDRFEVDVVPPLEVDFIEAEYDPYDKITRLSWAPVSSDVQGRGETISHYKVYRFERKGTFPHNAKITLLGKVIGNSEGLGFIDTEDAGPAPGAVAYYGVSAVDVAGNESGRSTAAVRTARTGSSEKRLRRGNRTQRAERPAGN